MANAPFAELPEAFRRLQQHLLKRPGGDREMVDVLALALQHDEGAVLRAVDMALTAGVPTKMHVLNLLHRLTTALLDRLTRRCARHCPRTNGGQWLALETGNDSFRFRASAGAVRKTKETTGIDPHMNPRP